MRIEGCSGEGEPYFFFIPRFSCILLVLHSFPFFISSFIRTLSLSSFLLHSTPQLHSTPLHFHALSAHTIYTAMSDSTVHAIAGKLPIEQAHPNTSRTMFPCVSHAHGYTLLLTEKRPHRTTHIQYYRHRHHAFIHHLNECNITLMENGTRVANILLFHFFFLLIE